MDEAANDSRISRTVAVEATSKRLTVRELRQFVRALDEAGIPEDTELQARTTMSGHLRRLQA